jgi:hypothetical protein
MWLFRTYRDGPFKFVLRTEAKAVGLAVGGLEASMLAGGGEAGEAVVWESRG